MSHKNQHIAEVNDSNNLFLMNDDERIKYINEYITHDPHFSDTQLDFYNFSIYINIALKTYFIHDKKNPIITKFGDAVYFEPSEKFISEDGFNKAYIKYVTHFISGYVVNEEKKDIRTFDRSKFSAIEFLIPALRSSNIVRLYQKASDDKRRKEAIIYANEIVIGKIKCIILVTETTQKGQLRSITFFPKDRCGYVQKQKASGEWSDAPTVTRSIERNSPPDETQTMSVGGNVRHDSNAKSNKKNDTNNKMSLELHDTNTGKVVIKYQIIGNQILVDGKNISFDELYRMFLKKTGRMKHGGIIESVMSFLNKKIFSLA